LIWDKQWNSLYPRPLLALHISLGLVKSYIAFDLVHALERLGIVPCCVFDFSLVGCDGVVARIAFVRTVGLCGGRSEVGFFDAVGRELWDRQWLSSGKTGDRGE
jgi:hypothetical protein